ncbi:hypothetical protein NIES4071_97950 [Calothrix sp. NIES-4071]|nr:hypothetical protein NIES4071_97950 [Calothrix sp. NIES-4071]BAZ64059.1 hypothetical protein NIES4105_97880 [Calothrix sp. NIES-4105]
MKLDTIPDKTSSDKPKTASSSKVREHLANERTYLAWVRSAISLIGFGVVIVRLRVLRPPMSPQPPGNGWKLGLAFSVVGLLTVLLSTQHYLAVRRDIDADTYEPGDRWVILSSIIILILGMGVIYYFFTVPLESMNTVIVE